MNLFAECLLAVAASSALLIGAVAIHEFGHVLANILVGLKVLSVRIGPLELKRGKSWAWRWVWNSWFSGLVKTSAVSLDQRWIAARYAFTVMCGPLANLFLAGVLLFFLGSYGGRRSSILFWVIAFNIMLGLLSLIPASGRQYDSDGKRIVQMIFRKRRREALESRMTYPIRLAEFKRAFASGEIKAAEEQLSFMEKVSGERNVAMLIAINAHLRDHLISGESLTNCTWRPPTNGAAKVNAPHRSLAT